RPGPPPVAPRPPGAAPPRHPGGPAPPRTPPAGQLEVRLLPCMPAADRLETRPLRIALLFDRGNPHSGGQGVYVHHLSKELVALGHHVEVFSGPPYPELVPEVPLVKV